MSTMFESLVEDMISTLASGLGKSLVTGDWENFGSEILSSFGKFAQQFGALLIAYGVSVTAFETAFANPAGAIIAGSALVLLGGAISEIATNAKSTVDSGSSGGSSSVTSYSGNTNRTVELKWKRAGKDLVAIIGEENASLKSLIGK